MSVANRGNYYEVIMDYTTGTSRYDMGLVLMQKIKQALPNFEQLMDSYMTEMTADPSTYNLALGRMADIKPQVPQEYQDEINGMASQLSGGDLNAMGDGKLSKDEFYMMQLVTDIARECQCSGISVYGPRSATGNTMTARILDWYDGSSHQLAQIQSVTTIKNGGKSICMIGYLGLMGILTGFNDDGIYAGILDSPSGATYTSKNKRSYIMDLRYALENCASLADVACFMTDASRNYAFNHLILLSDKNSSKVLENNFSGSGANMRRALRSDTSALNQGDSWGYVNAVATVNSFLLLGNLDNHTGMLFNTKRWNSLKTQLQLCGETVTLDELKSIAAFDNGDGPNYQSDGDIYNLGTQQIVIFRPDDFHLEVAFKPKSGILPTDPIFENMTASIPTSVASDHSRLPNSFMLEQNYPNPFNPATKISFCLPARSFATLKVFDLNGKEVSTLVSEELDSGNHTRLWNAEWLASGVYFYRLQAGPFLEIKKCILIK